MFAIKWICYYGQLVNVICLLFFFVIPAQVVDLKLVYGSLAGFGA